MSFDALAPWYRTLEWITFGDALQRSRVAALGEIGSPRNALIVGEGNGRFLCELLRRHPAIQVDCVDASQRMLQLARKRVEHGGGYGEARVRWLHQDITVWKPPEQSYDLVVTHFVLDCFAQTDLALIVRKLARAATEQSSWLLADFRVPNTGLARRRARVWLAMMYRFFRLTAGIQASELIDPTSFMLGEGFMLVRQQLLRGGMLKSEIWRRKSLGAC